MENHGTVEPEGDMIQLLFESITLAALLRIDHPGQLVLAVDLKWRGENMCCNSRKKQRSEK